MKNNKKQFDCIKMKSDIQAQIYAETQNMSSEELLNYFNNTTKNGVQLQKQRKQSVKNNKLKAPAFS